ncbi:MAG TPA: thioredoxin domain-containing protein [Thermoanaerobaculia bacterium]|nr:thioredoxin domain-containing protein [Thermoanaerobaculia bacterium]
MSSTLSPRTRSQGLLFGVLALVLALCVWLPACSAQTKSGKDSKMESDPNKVLAKVNGKTITEGDLEKAAAAEFQQLERECSNNRHNLVENKLKQMVQDTMVEAEAKAKGVSKDQLIADATKAAPVTDADADKFYDENKAQIPPNVTKEQVMPRIKQYLEQQRQNEARQAFYASLDAKYKADYMLEPVRVPVEAAAYAAPVQGPTTAPVTIVEFSDFQCPFCSRLKPTLDQVKQKYGDKVRIVFRQYPLPIHNNAPKAAEAALCANDQGKFWEMHDAMFADQGGLAPDSLKAKATKIGLKADQFAACLDADKHADEIKKDMAAGTAAGVNGTPAMFVNGRFINGAVPIDDITKVIDDELKRGEKSAKS